ncbi:hypothetical protein D3C86_2113610 [compost metagenome]
MGAEKSRRMDGTGSWRTLVKRKVCSASFSSSTAVVAPTTTPSSASAMSLPSASSRPTATGMWNGSLLVWPGVSGQRWLSVTS